MPRLTPFRIVKVILYVWLAVIAVWSLLPSPSIPYAEESQHNRRILRAGQTLTTVQTYASGFRSGFEELNLNEKGYYIFDWQLRQNEKGEVRLVIGDNAPINLADVVKRQDKFHLSKSTHDAVRTPMFDNSTGKAYRVSYTSDVKCANVCLPWFNSNDKVLLAHDLSGLSADFGLTLSIDTHGMIEVWNYHHVEKTLEMLERARKDPEAMSYSEGQLYEEAFEYLHSQGYPLMQLYGGDMTDLDSVEIPYVSGNLPSKTYHIRKKMLLWLYPIIRIALLPIPFIIRLSSGIPTFLLFIAIEGGLACGGIMLSCWLRDGRPEFSRWIRTFWMTRWMFPGSAKTPSVWGPAGPVSKSRTRKDWQGSGGVGLKRPQTVRLGRSWDAV